MTNEGQLIEANNMSVEACGYRLNEVLGKAFWETAWWRNHKESQEKIRAAIPLVAKGVPYRETLLYAWADGSEHIVDLALFPIVDHNSKVIFIHPTGVDIAELKRTEENYRNLAERLEAEVRARTTELEKRNREVTKQSELLRNFSYRLLQVQDEERRRIARELHDSSGQITAALGMTLSSMAAQLQLSGTGPVKEIEDSLQLVQQLSQEIRTMSYLLHPPLLEERGVQGALEWYVQGFKERSGIDMQLEIPDGFERLPPEMELVVFRMVQEALTNVHRHSGSKRGAIRVSRTDGQIFLEIEDFGCGMSPERLAEIESKGAGVGLQGMRERVRQFQGELKIHSDSGGTRLCVVLPLPRVAKSSGTPPFERLRVN